MHFWNKLSTAALMRLTILASLNLLMGRILGYWLVLHPVFLLILVTLDLGLYALMVYSGTLNKSLIAMMLTGLTGVLAAMVFDGADASTFADGGRYQHVAEGIEGLVNKISGSQAPPQDFWWRYGVQIAFIVVDAIGLAVILAVGLVARALQARSHRRGTPAPSPSS
jgi:hypothetical protein